MPTWCGNLLTVVGPRDKRDRFMEPAALGGNDDEAIARPDGVLVHHKQFHLRRE